MGRPAKPWFRAYDGYWYATITPGAQPEKLAKGRGAEKEALIRFNELTKRGRRPYDLRPSEILISEFLDHTARTRKPRTYENYADLLSAFCKSYGNVKVADLKREHATAFIEKQESKKRRKLKYKATVKQGRNAGKERRFVVTLKPWSPNRSATFSAVLKACFNWAVKTKKITENPFHSLDRPYKATRQRVFSPDEFQLLLDSTDEPFRNVLFALRNTGCRPAEVASLTAAQVDLRQGCWVLDSHKTEKTGPKVVWLNDDMIALTRTLLDRHPEGPLFRNGKGTAWNHSTIAHKFRLLRQKLGLSEDAVPYATRHTFITDALLKEIPIATVAAHVGHTSTQMIQRRYGHLDKHAGYLRSAMQRATEKTA